jgi:AcrR family transcriptional regulator
MEGLQSALVQARPDRKGAEATRERILEAALEEFGAKGYAGARTAGIARRAGVNPQLISYHFGGKQGLLDELRRRGQDRRAELAATAGDRSFDASFGSYLDDALDNAHWSRLAVWRALGDDPGLPGDDDGSRLRAEMAPAIASLARRQAAGELTDAVEPAFVLLLAHALAFAPIALPQFVDAILGVEPGSAEYRQRCREQLAALLGTPTDHQPIPREEVS